MRLRNLRITFLDVGQGNAALIQFPGKKRMLIDGGGFLGGTFDTGKGVVAPFLFRKKLLHIDYLVLTHPHPDHLKGLNFIASEFDPSEFWYNGNKEDSEEFKDLMEIVRSKNIKIVTPDDLKQGRDISGVKIEIFYPLSDKNNPQNHYFKSRAVNDQSLVLKFRYMGRSVMFPGDIEMKAEALLVNKYGKKIKSDVLLVPHHGSKYSSSTTFLETVKPELCIISSREGNSFGFPHAESLARLKHTNAKILRIDQGGAVEVTIGEELFYAGYYPD
jgi:competence protein ComEC